MVACNLTSDQSYIKEIRIGNYWIQFWEEGIIRVIRQPIFWGNPKYIAEWKVAPFKNKQEEKKK